MTYGLKASSCHPLSDIFYTLNNGDNESFKNEFWINNKPE